MRRKSFFFKILTKYLTVTFKMRPLSGHVQNSQHLGFESRSRNSHPTSRIIMPRTHKSVFQDDKPKKKSKQLQIPVCNFQGIWNKHVLLKHHLSENNIDIDRVRISLVTKHLKFLPEDYTAVRDIAVARHPSKFVLKVHKFTTS